MPNDLKYIWRHGCAFNESARSNVGKCGGIGATIEDPKPADRGVKTREGGMISLMLTGRWRASRDFPTEHFPVG